MASRKRKDKKKRPIGRPQRPVGHLPQAADAAREMTRRFGQEVEVIHNPAGEVKMSEVLLDFLEPFFDPTRSLKELTGLVNFGSAAWNAALMPGPLREKALREATAHVPPQDRPVLEALLEGMVRRKLTLFAGNTRAILDTKLTLQPDGSPHLSVVSTLPLPPAGPNLPFQPPPHP